VRYFSEKLSALVGNRSSSRTGRRARQYRHRGEAKSRPDGYTMLIAPGTSTMAVPLGVQEVAIKTLADLTTHPASVGRLGAVSISQ